MELVLKEMGKLDLAEKYLVHLLNQLPNGHKDIERCCFKLGRVAYDKGDYESSLTWYKKSLDLKLRTKKSDDPDIGHNLQ